jgi:hypothetical protein
MRRAAALLVLCALLAPALGVAHDVTGARASIAPGAGVGDVPSLQGEAPEPGTTADEDGDDVVEVQLVVLGLVILTVVVAGTGAYLLRRRLGLTQYNPEDHAASHH